jgi:hypothetical protein
VQNSGRDSIRGIFRQCRRAYLALNIAYYGLVIAAMLFVSTQLKLQRSLLGIINVSYNQTLPLVLQAYESENFPLAAGLTFLINFALSSLVVTTLPNMVVPFWGIFIGLVRAMAWGLILAPTQPFLAMAMIPHYLTLILEGQGYILAMFAAYVHWQAVLKPESVGAATRWSAYKIGLKRTGRIYPPGGLGPSGSGCLRGIRSNLHSPASSGIARRAVEH